MISSPRRSPRSPRQQRLDQATAALLHVVMVPGWSPQGATSALWGRLDHDPVLLRLLHARVSRAMLGGATRTDRRALATLDYALAELGPPAPLLQPTRPRRSFAHD